MDVTQIKYLKLSYITDSFVVEIYKYTKVPLCNFEPIKSPENSHDLDSE